MLALSGYLLVIFALLLFLLLIIIFTLFLIYSSLMGSPYVPTRKKDIEIILQEANLKKGKVFVELGCGDGRVTRSAVGKYGVRGVGVDINPIIIWLAKFWAKMEKIRKITFKRQNIFETDLSDADYIYLFLYPPIIKKLTPKFEKELKKDVLVISHGFKIEDWKKKLIKMIPHSPFPTYFYLFDKTS
jgi:tRNA A58 N-methylase Trm61